MDNKVKNIINEEFDSRMGLAVIQYLCEQVGIDKAKEITDAEIESIEGNAFMTKEFNQAFVRCARRIARECNFLNDIVPYLINEWGHLSGRITQERTAEILDRYIEYVGDDLMRLQWTLYEICDCTDEELEDLGYGYLIEDEESEDAV